MSRARLQALGGLALALPLLTACAAGDTGGSTDRTGATSRATSSEVARAASFYTPARGPLPLRDAAGLTAPTNAPLKAALYVGECATPWAWPDHISYLQGLGLAVVVPRFGGDRCVEPTDRLGNAHSEIDRVVGELGELAWIDADEVFLVGHGVGADVASTYTESGVFKGVVGLAAACPFGVQNQTPMLTFRTLDDRVLRNRGTRCTQYESPNALHIEFAGSDHALALGPGAGRGGARELMRNAIAAFIAAGASTATIAERDAADLRQLGGGGSPAAPPADASNEPTSGIAGEPSATPDPSTAPATPGAAPFGDDEVIFIPDLQLPQGRP